MTKSRKAGGGGLAAAIRLWRYLADNRFGLTIPEIMQFTRRSRRQAYRMIDHLEEAGVAIDREYIEGPNRRHTKFRLRNRREWIA